MNIPYAAAGPRMKEACGTDVNLAQRLESSLDQFGLAKPKLDRVNHSQHAIPEQEK